MKSQVLKNLIYSTLIFLVNLTKIFILSLNLFINKRRKIESKTLLIVRTDRIGDYVLFRNFLEKIKISTKYKDYKITLIGNSDWIFLSKNLDKDYIDDFISINTKSFTFNFFYRLIKMREITSKGYEVVLNAVSSRDFIISDSIVKVLSSNKKIGFHTEAINSSIANLKKSNSFYSELISIPNDITFEFERNKNFYQKFLDIDLNNIKPKINLSDTKNPIILPKKYALLCIEAGHKSRIWNTKNFVEVASHIQKKFDYEIVLCGSSSKLSLRLAGDFKKNFEGRVYNFVGKTSIMELCYIVSSSSLILSNETSVPHIAVALSASNIFVISNGNQFGRFTPYPKKYSTSYNLILHPKIEKDLNFFYYLVHQNKKSSVLNINDISPEKVKVMIDKNLKLID